MEKLRRIVRIDRNNTNVSHLLSGDPQSVPLLIALLNSDDEEVRLFAIDALSLVGLSAADAAPRLWEIELTGSALVRQTARDALYKIDPGFLEQFPEYNAPNRD